MKQKNRECLSEHQTGILENLYGACLQHVCSNILVDRYSTVLWHVFPPPLATTVYYLGSINFFFVIFVENTIDIMTAARMGPKSKSKDCTVTLP